MERIPSQRRREDQLSGRAVDPQHVTLEWRLRALRAVLLKALSTIDSVETSVKMGGHYPINLRDEVNRFEAELIRAALLQADGNQVRAASLLGLRANTLNYKIERLGLRKFVH